MGNLSELKGVERLVREWLSQMGWTHRSNDELKQYNRPFSNPLIEPILIERTVFLNGITEAIAKLAIETLLLNLKNSNPIEGNEAFLDKLVSKHSVNCVFTFQTQLPTFVVSKVKSYDDKSSI